MKKLRRYWFGFGQLSKPSILNLGCGVTAFDYGDAIRLLRERLFREGELPNIVALP
ncbi:MAG TPA: hypothetical protein VHC20_04475 [Candidatus Paceibacterota bacterium]|nr:hypothetical protein [Candidatus Paceibacterota bacterium]